MTKEDIIKSLNYHKKLKKEYKLDKEFDILINYVNSYDNNNFNIKQIYKMFKILDKINIVYPIYQVPGYVPSIFGYTLLKDKEYNIIQKVIDKALQANNNATFVDVGGGIGLVSRIIKEKNPNLRVINLDNDLYKFNSNYILYYKSIKSYKIQPYDIFFISWPDDNNEGILRRIDKYCKNGNYLIIIGSGISVEATYPENKKNWEFKKIINLGYNFDDIDMGIYSMDKNLVIKK